MKRLKSIVIMNSLYKYFKKRIRKFIYYLKGFDEKIQINKNYNEQNENVILIQNKQIVECDLESYKRFIKNKLLEKEHPLIIVDDWMDYWTE